MLVITIDLARPSFHGQQAPSTESVDWPPSPLRLVGALVAGAHSLHSAALRDTALGVIRRITTAPSPVIEAPEALPLGLRPYFAQKTGVPPGLTAANGLEEFLSVDYFGLATKSKTLKPNAGIALSDTRIRYLIAGITTTADELTALRAAAGAVPYFGRSNDAAIVTVGDTEPEPLPLRRLLPFEDPRGSTRGWTSRSVDWMDLNYELMANSRDAPQIPDTAYSVRLAYRAVPSALSKPLQVVPLRSALPGRQVPGFMARLEVPNGAVAFPLVVAGAPHSDGRCLGIGFQTAGDGASPVTDMVSAVIRAERPTAAPILELSQRKTLDPERWTRAARSWVSATPVRAFPDVRVLEYLLRQRFGDRFALLRADREPMESWQQRWPSPPGLVDGLAQWWVKLRLPTPTAGPLRIGTANELGFGLMIPDSSEGRPERG